ncbi:hypothetical protein [Actinophytocola glycyrrhizae]|uniref:Uncharacterized protein n=1 Tax=Actinophytocola glycyrrhizae TaxID=2044873 RepID=A0ABV9RUT0_9PSEU
MREEPESAGTFRLYATLAALPVVYAVLLLVLPSLLSEQILSVIKLDMTLSIGALVPLLIVSGLMLEQAFAARRRSDPRPPE